MELSTAVLLIKDGVGAGAPQSWADLGAGKGTFTNALSTVLKSGKIVAVDKDERALRSIRLDNASVKLELLSRDLLDLELEEGALDGILMANSIHYVKDKVPYLKKIMGALKRPGGRIVVVEYDMDAPNPYVPYPVSFSSLRTISERVGFGSCVKMEVVPSVYQRAGIYSALLRE